MTDSYLAHHVVSMPHQVVLVHITAAFKQNGFKDIEHQRLSLLSNVCTSEIYQGLSQAEYVKDKSNDGLNNDGLNKVLNFKMKDSETVMLKWELQPLGSLTHFNFVNSKASASKESLATLSNIDKEIAILKSIHKKPIRFKANLDNPNLNPQPFVIPIACNSLIQIVINNQIWQLKSFAMPLYKLGSCRDYLKGQSLGVEQKQQLILQMAITLNQFHESGWLHGDIKPSNFLLTNSLTNGEARLATVLCDFGNAQAISTMKDKHILSKIEPQALIDPQGTPAYLAPECWQGRGMNVQTDIYAFGVSVYEILLGEKPFKVKSGPSEVDLKEKNRYQTKENAIAHAWAKLHCQSPIPTLPEHLQPYQTISRKLLAKRVENRYQDMQSVIADLIQLNKPSTNCQL